MVAGIGKELMELKFLDDFRTERSDDDKMRPYDESAARALGRDLKARREEQNIPLREGCNHTRVSMRFLEAIESGDYRVLPAGIYVKGFITAYAKSVGFVDFELPYAKSTDSNPVANPLPQTQINSQRRQSDAPPKLAEYLLYFLLTKGERIYLIG